DGASLLTFYHRQLAEVVTAAFLSRQVGRVGQIRHRALAHYFTTHNGHAGTSQQGSANLRRLSELPYQQTMGELWDDLYQTLTSFDFLQQKATALNVLERRDAHNTTTKVYTGAYEIQDDLFRALQLWPSGERREHLHILDNYSQAINREIAFLARRGDLLWQ